MYISYEPYISVWNFTQNGGLSNISKGSSYVYVSLRRTYFFLQKIAINIYRI